MLSVGAARRAASSPLPLLVIGLACALGYLVALAWAMNHVSYDIWGALVIGPVLVAVSIPILIRAARTDSDPLMGKVLFAAFGAKMLGSVLRYAITFEIYGGRADAGGYHGSGSRLAEAFWNGTWDRVVRQEVPELVGTEFIRLVTGAVYIVTGPSKLGGFLVFGWLGFWGLFAFYQAFRLAFPEGDHRRYAFLAFFLPSLLYWPSSIGKEAWMLFTLGIVAYGAAMVLRYRPLGYAVLAIGMIGTAAVRPHVTLIAFVAFFIAYLLRRRSWMASRLGLLGRIIGVAVLVGAGALVVAQTAHFFHVETIDTGSVEQVLDRATDQSAKGGSEFDAGRLTSPSEVPSATLSVLFRPYPWEAGNAQALVAATEGTLLLVIFILSLPRLIRVPRFSLRVPYVAFAFAYTALFILAFSTIGNFGLLTRQRTQVFPFVLVLLAIPPRSRDPELRSEASRSRSRRSPADDVTPTTAPVG
jgi:hypothetical protein